MICQITEGGIIPLSILLSLTIEYPELIVGRLRRFPIPHALRTTLSPNTMIACTNIVLLPSLTTSLLPVPVLLLILSSGDPCGRETTSLDTRGKQGPLQHCCGCCLSCAPCSCLQGQMLGSDWFASWHWTLRPCYQGSLLIALLMICRFVVSVSRVRLSRVVMPVPNESGWKKCGRPSTLPPPRHRWSY